MAKLKEIEVSLGVSVEVDKTWYRLNAREVVELDVTDTVEKRSQIWEKMWQDCQSQIADQVRTLAQK